MNGSQLAEKPTGVQWQIGGEATVSWQVRNNHGGGYQYRLCPASEELSEECFQRHPLDFVPEKSGFLFEDGSWELIEPVLVSDGVLPEGSTWARIPIAPTKLGPYCKPGPDDDPDAPKSCAAENNPSTPCGCTPCPQTPGSDCSRCDNCYEQTSFPPYMHNGEEVKGVGPIVGIMDAVKVPAHLTPGKYVLGWRYECEATAQVWSNCADIELVADSVPAAIWPPAPPTPPSANTHLCASGEGDLCMCTGSVYYGRKFAHGKPGSGATTSIDELMRSGFVKKSVSGSIDCSYGAMGRDPLRGYYKYCFCDPGSHQAALAV